MIEIVAFTVFITGAAVMLSMVLRGQALTSSAILESHSTTTPNEGETK